MEVSSHRHLLLGSCYKAWNQNGLTCLHTYLHVNSEETQGESERVMSSLAWKVICVSAISHTLQLQHQYSLWNAKNPTAGQAAALKPGPEPVFTSGKVPSECCQSINAGCDSSVHQQIFRSQWDCHAWPLMLIGTMIFRLSPLPPALSSVYTTWTFYLATI